MSGILFFISASCEPLRELVTYISYYSLALTAVNVFYALTGSAAFVLRSATHTLFYINLWCKKAHQLSDDHTIGYKKISNKIVSFDFVHSQQGDSGRRLPLRHPNRKKNVLDEAIFGSLFDLQPGQIVFKSGSGTSKLRRVFVTIPFPLEQLGWLLITFPLKRMTSTYHQNPDSHEFSWWRLRVHTLF